MKRQLLHSAATFSIFLGLCTTPPAHAQNTPTRFDLQVRDDIFAGFAGDEAALARGLAAAAETLKSAPNHPEALVWLGSGKAFQAGQFFQKGDTQNGIPLWTEALSLMNRAVAIAPNHIGVRIPRGATLAAATRGMPAEMAQPLIQLALSDYAKAFELQRNHLDRLSPHARGELLLGLADLTERAGPDSGDWRSWARKTVGSLPSNSPYHRRAAVWLEKGALPSQARTCLGCHVNAQ
ncbi:MAG: hypothetical protein M9913_23175 [Bryobacteraceae bacterium]|nr:hypothetical protein [Solibacteraceae bacterium]MCO5353741.1 hypothetical protein [Bryobacteraceae bacterium]